MLIYGSYAMKHWFDDYFRPAPDIDIVVYDNDLYDQTVIDNLKKHNLPIEIQPAEEAFFYKMFEDQIIDYFLTPDAMLTVRMSHAMYAYNLDKALNDIMFLQDKGAKYDLEKLLELRKHWKKRYAGFREKMDMNQSPEVFFNSNVTRFVEHDELHDLLKFDNVPAFTKILRDDKTVAVSKDKFNSLTHQEKIHTFMEEILVLACERYYYLQTPKEAIAMSCGDFLTRMTSGWYNIFLLENIKYVFQFDDKEKLHLMDRIMQYLRMQSSKNEGVLNSAEHRQQG